MLVPEGASSELEAEVGMLKEQLGKAKGINDAMWETVVQRVIGQGKGKEKETQGKEPEVNGTGDAMEVDEQHEGERRRKRGRT